ncbi:Transcription factor [Mycoemilia scoparia]|uniref:Transcription factor n=1 Tax=Mycoemilia scoparia TaxID=417184 RepID=A0A9W8A3V6_9FUNG|nr:Transcription factor [Mycoemilia scoparia]
MESNGNILAHSASLLSPHEQNEISSFLSDFKAGKPSMPQTQGDQSSPISPGEPFPSMVGLGLVSPITTSYQQAGIHMEHNRTLSIQATPRETDTPTTTATPTARSKKTQPKPRRMRKKGELLNEEEKKANHIASEQKRRQNIKAGYAQLSQIVPTLSQNQRSEAIVLQKSKNKHIFRDHLDQ